jgi:hypothetical protein
LLGALAFFLLIALSLLFIPPYALLVLKVPYVPASERERNGVGRV